MATPCSAPFLGTAIGFALGPAGAVVFAIFTALGLGMALPYLLLAAAPGVARLLPRPGAWMETVRGVMGFLLAAAAVWLFYVLSAQVRAGAAGGDPARPARLALFTWLASTRRGGRTGGAARHGGAAVIAAIVITMCGDRAAGARGEARRQLTAAGQPA